MKQSPNKNIGKNKFLNICSGKKEGSYFFIFPMFAISPKKQFQYDMTIFSIFLAWGRFHFQINICEITKESNPVFGRIEMEKLMGLFNEYQLKIDDMRAAKEFIDKNPHITLLLKNGNLDHHYVKTILIQTFTNQPWIKKPVPARIIERVMA